MNRIVLASMAALFGASAFAAPVTYTLDPNHTYPSFEADHFGGLSTWRGKFDSTSGKVVYDKDAKAGSIDVTVDMSSIDFGMPKLNEHAKSPEIFDAAKYPNARFVSTKVTPTAPDSATITGKFTLHGVTKPVTLKARLVGSGTNPMDKTFNVGFEAVGKIRRSDFGIKQYLPLVGDEVTLKIAGGFVLQQ